MRVAIVGSRSVTMDCYPEILQYIPRGASEIVSGGAEGADELAQKYGKSIGQIILRWHVQQGNVMPVFKSYNPKRFVENVDVLDFELTEDEMNSIYSLNQNYKYHIESINCPGY